MDSEWATNSANGSISSLIVWTDLQPPGNVATVSVFARSTFLRRKRSREPKPWSELPKLFFRLDVFLHQLGNDFVLALEFLP